MIIPNKNLFKNKQYPTKKHFQKNKMNTKVVLDVITDHKFSFYNLKTQKSNGLIHKANLIEPAKDNKMNLRKKKQKNRLVQVLVCLDWIFVF